MPDQSGTALKLGKDTLGRLFIDGNGVVWEQITYTDLPTAGFRRAVDHSQRLSGVVGSRLLSDLELLSDRDEQMFKAGLDRG